MKYTYRKHCCKECPWQKTAPVGHFGPDAYRRLAPTAYDMDRMIFTCHMSTEAVPAICAGFLLKGADHNLTVRLECSKGLVNRRLVKENGEPMFESYREMAEANGVDPNDPVLKPCR